jgi:hypothetical protein
VTDVAILCPGFPTAPGGVTDHTARVLARWTERRIDVTVLEHPSQLRALSVAALLVQYVPFLYGRSGLSPELVTAVRQARSRKTRVTLFVHEPWVPPTRLPWLALSGLQRWQLRHLAREATGVVTPVPAWCPLLPGAPEVLYVGSTLGDPPDAPGSDPDLAAPVVFSPFASGLDWSWILAARDAIGTDPALVIVGATLDDARTRLPALPGDAAKWEWRGRGSASETLAMLARARLVLAPYVDGLTGRRTAALAALSVGTPLVSSTGPLFDPIFADAPVGLADGADSFGATARALWEDAAPDRTARRAWFDAHFNADALDDRLLDIVLGAGR